MGEGGEGGERCEGGEGSFPELGPDLWAQILSSGGPLALLPAAARPHVARLRLQRRARSLLGSLPDYVEGERVRALSEGAWKEGTLHFLPQGITMVSLGGAPRRYLFCHCADMRSCVRLRRGRSLPLVPAPSTSTAALARLPPNGDLLGSASLCSPFP